RERLSDPERGDARAPVPRRGLQQREHAIAGLVVGSLGAFELGALTLAVVHGVARAAVLQAQLAADLVVRRALGENGRPNLSEFGGGDHAGSTVHAGVLITAARAHKNAKSRPKGDRLRCAPASRAARAVDFDMAKLDFDRGEGQPRGPVRDYALSGGR